MMKVHLKDLNEHLFAQLERLSDEDLKGEALVREIDRTKAITSVAREIVDTGKLALDAQKALGAGAIRSAPPMLGIDPK